MSGERESEANCLLLLSVVAGGRVAHDKRLYFHADNLLAGKKNHFKFPATRV